MELFTSIPRYEYKIKLQLQDKFFCIGSCFSHNIHEKLQAFSLQSLHNPLGTVFHPQAILQQLKYLLKKHTYRKDQLFSYQGVHHALDFAYPFHHKQPEVLLEKIHSIIQQTYEHLQSTTVLIITFGTSWKYHLLSNDTMVANCHKIPQKFFKKILSSPTEIAQTILEMDQLLWHELPYLKTIIYTISPVRHSKDGFFENHLSKGLLFYGMYHLKNTPTKSIYFPVYEWMMDELRDYRFYAEDLIHPNNLAIQWIWEKFSEYFFDERSRSEILSIEKKEKSNHHRSLSIFSDD